VPSSKFDGLAKRLVAAMEEAGHDVLKTVGDELALATIADIPVGDPARDPDPGYSLADHVSVTVLPRYVLVRVEGAYAVKQHEALHFKHPRGGRAKFLEANAILMAKVFEKELRISVQKTFASKRSRTRFKSTVL
jgi:hypothetical protein